MAKPRLRRLGRTAVVKSVTRSIRADANEAESRSNNKENAIKNNQMHMLTNSRFGEKLEN